MKRMVVIAVAFVSVSMQAQMTYDITGSAPANVKKVYVVDVAKRFSAVDSAIVTAGKFHLKGSQPKDAVLGVGDTKTALLFLNDGTPLVADLGSQTLKGSALNEKLNAYDRELTVFDSEIGKIVAAARAGEIPQAQMDSVSRRYMALAEQKENRVMEIISENKDNMIPVAFISDVAQSLEYDLLKEVCDPKRPYYNHSVMQLPKRLLASLQKRRPGMKFHDMQIPDIDGKQRALSEWLGKGQYVMIDFWASWCGPCRQEMPNVVANYAKYHGKGFEIIGISFDQKEEAWKNGVRQLGMTWPQLSDLGYWNSAAASVYGINSIPASILFDGNGVIVAVNLRGEKLGEKLKEIYGF